MYWTASFVTKLAVTHRQGNRHRETAERAKQSSMSPVRHCECGFATEAIPLRTRHCETAERAKQSRFNNIAKTMDWTASFVTKLAVTHRQGNRHRARLQ